ncbi:aldehyde dehydrogenase family protein [Streptomyces spiramenti]|uniref:Aldehyde dehydrogenase family protein n=1 Tax=Streptomyces spiramenti TaxID=2720606 RepID=A0ABX1AKX9_9ACTN|nr:aldehyde dehydrogenase family protein [Streptomyces spiramenti]NJP66043.1 aldehyde dehydrogenase family protein [Streptomyces spiramenti]
MSPFPAWVEPFAAQQFLAGAWRTGTGGWDVVDFDPWTGAKLTSITVATAVEVDTAYLAAEQAQRDWAVTGPHERRAVLLRAAKVLGEREAEILDAMTTELGATRWRAAHEVALARDFLDEVAQLPLRSEGRVVPSTVDGKENHVTRVPCGTVCVIGPSTFPLLLALKPVAAALALGNAVVLKPHQAAPVCGGVVIARLLEEAGLPPGLLSVLTTDVAEVGDALIEHRVPQVVCFTGSEESGRHVAAVAGRNLKRAVLETGGTSSLLVLDDADLDRAAEAAVFSRFLDAGRLCMSASRVLVDRAVLEPFTERLLARVTALRAGDPRDPGVQVGPLMAARDAERLDVDVRAAVAAGARMLVGGARAGNLLPPTVLTDVPAGAALLHREIFGPVVVVRGFTGEDEAVRVANSTTNGLSGAVFTRDVRRGLRVAQRIESGVVHVNDATLADEPLVPFGSEKRSGLGRLNGEAMVDAFTTAKWISVRHGHGTYPL